MENILLRPEIRNGYKGFKNFFSPYYNRDSFTLKEKLYIFWFNMQRNGYTTLGEGMFCEREMSLNYKETSILREEFKKDYLEAMKNIDQERQITIDDALTLLNRGAKAANQKIAIRRLKELLTIKRNAEVILNDDTVNSWGKSNVTPKYSITEVKAAQEAFSNAVSESDRIIEGL